MAHPLETLRHVRRTVSTSAARATSALAAPFHWLTPRGAEDPATSHRTWLRAIRLVFVLLLIAVVVNGLIALRSFRLLVAGERLVTQARANEARIAAVETRLLDAENSQRDYLLTGDPKYLSSYAAARAAVETELEQLQALTADDAQQQRVTALKPLISARLAELQQSIDLRSQQRLDAAIAVLGSAASAQTTADIRALLSELAAEEARLRDDRLRAANQSLTDAQITTLVATLADILLVLAFFVFVQRSFAAREQHLLHEQQARATAETAVELRDQFLSIASHELRTPITALFTTAALLERRFQPEIARDELQRQSFAVLQRQLARLETLIAAMLDISRIDRGQLGLIWERVDLVALVRTVVEEVRVTTEAHTIEVGSPVHELLVRGDALRLEQVVQNLLQNAIKYSPEGGPIQVELQRVGEWASLTVADRGIGIPQDVLPQIFDRFYRAPAVRSEHISGLGIGLYVTREIVELHQGEITVSSTEGVGSIFTVRLPLLTPAAESQEAAG